ncbi:hypothetical protein BIW11_10290, partial [Tropilaelaps mercedesae]
YRRNRRFRHPDAAPHECEQVNRRRRCLWRRHNCRALRITRSLTSSLHLVQNEEVIVDCIKLLWLS